MLFNIAFVLFIIAFNCMNIAESEEKVIFAAIIYRHGERTIVEPYPNDPWRNNSYWSAPFGQLTNKGKWQHFRLGAWLRRRYSNLLSVNYLPNEIYVQSTDFDRTLMSAQANLAGLYPPEGNQVWDAKLLWQPVPVHTQPKKVDDLLVMGKPCPALDKEKAKFSHSEYVTKLNKKYASLYKYTTEHTGKTINNMKDASYLHDTLMIEEQNNMKLPNWTKKVYPEPLKEITKEEFLFKTFTPKLARLVSGPLLKEITGLMQARRRMDLNRGSNGDDDNKSLAKLMVYSGHDTTLVNLLNAMGLYDKDYPPTYTSTLFFDLIRDNITGEYKVRVSFRNSVDIVEPQVLSVSSCGICPLDLFATYYEPLISVNWDEECLSPTHLFKTDGFIPIAFGVLIICIIISCLLAVFISVLCGKSDVFGLGNEALMGKWNSDNMQNVFHSLRNDLKYISDSDCEEI